ncbi:MAG: hypothetical protein M1126_06930 [Candidatus Thermoplasmatota archaeon]|jgi:predicted transcriptional regulator|nr:hypothetical protein [Candidatus Thermoplasmatota archaeon]
MGDAQPPAEESAESPPTTDGTRLAERIASELELLSRNVDLLERLANNPPMGIIRLSEAMQLPIHKVRYSLHLLEREGVIQPSADGAVVTDMTAEYWSSLDRHLEKMSSQIQLLKSRAAEHRAQPPPRRKGY